MDYADKANLVFFAKIAGSTGGIGRRYTMW